MKHITALAFTILFPIIGLAGNRENAKAIIAPLINAVRSSVNGERIEATEFSFNGRDYIVAFDSSEESTRLDSITIYSTFKKNNIWQVPAQHKILKYHKEGEAVTTRYCDGPETVMIGNSLYINLSYNNAAVSGDFYEHVEVMVEQSGGKVTFAVFAGKRLNGRKLEGKHVYVNTEEEDENAMNYMTSKIEGLDYLVSINESDAMSDRLMEEWNSTNPNASDKAKSITFIPVPDESSISDEYGSRKFGKESGEGYSAVLMNFRGNTIICCADRNGSKKLVWCEPQCTDRTSGKYLHTIFFEQKSTIALFYYHGRKSFKYRINLDTGRITR